jgi:hypothetical protein
MHSDEFQVSSSAQYGDLIVDLTTGYAYEVTSLEASNLNMFGVLPQTVIDLAHEHRGQHTIDLANAEAEATFAAFDARREQRAIDAKAARWAAGENVR